MNGIEWDEEAFRNLVRESMPDGTDEKIIQAIALVFVKTNDDLIKERNFYRQVIREWS